MINHRDQLYAFSSHGKAERYDPVFDCWSTLDHLKLYTRISCKVTLIRDQFYSLEIVVSSRKSTI